MTLRPCCSQEDHDTLRSLPLAAWELLEFVGTQWLPSEMPTHEDKHDLRNCQRCRSTLSRIVDSRVVPWSASNPTWWGPKVNEPVQTWLLRILREITPKGQDPDKWASEYLGTGPTLSNLMLRLETEIGRRRGVRPEWQDRMLGGKPDGAV